MFQWLMESGRLKRQAGGTDRLRQKQPRARVGGGGATALRARSIAALVATVTLLAGCASPSAPAAPTTAPTAAPKPAATTAPATAPTSVAAPAAATTSAPKPAAAPPAAAASPAVSATQQAGIVSLKVAEHGLLSNAPLYVAQDKGYFAEQGIAVNFQRMQSGAAMIAPLSTDQVDVAIGAPSAGLFNSMARGVPIKIVADKGTDFNGKSFAALVIRAEDAKNGTIKSYADLKGKKLAYAGKGSSNEVDLARALEKGGYTMQDADTQVLGYPEMLAGLTSGALDGALMAEPFVAQAVDAGVGVRWGAEDFYPDAEQGVLMYGPRLTGADKATGVKFMVAYLKGARDYMDAFEKGKDKDAIVASLMKNTGTSDRSLFDKMVPAGIRRNGYVNVSDLEAQQSFYLKTGDQQEPVDMQKAVDNSFADAALNVVGKQ